MPPHVDLVILFSAGVPSINKAQVKENIQQAEEQYTSLLNLLKSSGLHAVGKRGEKLGELMILVKCPQQKLDILARAERYVYVRFGHPGFGVVTVLGSRGAHDCLNEQGIEFYSWTSGA
jgi:anoctamin-10